MRTSYALQGLILCTVLLFCPVLIGETQAEVTRPNVEQQTATARPLAAKRTGRVNAPDGARVPGSRTKASPDADWVPFAAMGLMVFFFIALFGLKALKSRRGKTSMSSKGPPQAN
jgi:hypothetical protein